MNGTEAEPDPGSNGWWSAGRKVPTDSPAAGSATGRQAQQARPTRPSTTSVSADESQWFTPTTPLTPTTPHPRPDHRLAAHRDANSGSATETTKVRTPQFPPAETTKVRTPQSPPTETTKVRTPQSPPTETTKVGTPQSLDGNGGPATETAKVGTPQSLDGNGGPASGRRRRRRTSEPEAAVWVNARPEVLQSCGVALRRMGDEVRSVGVTSTARREGRTTIAMGMAEAASLGGRNTILIDLDLQRPGIPGAAAEQNVAGIRQYLRGEAPIHECLFRVSDHLQVVNAGGVDPDHHVARSDRFADLIAELSRRCEVLVADLPSLQSGVDAARMSDVFESVVLVVRAGGVTIPQIEESVAVLGRRPVVVLNGKGRAKRTLFGRTRGL